MRKLLSILTVLIALSACNQDEIIPINMDNHAFQLNFMPIKSGQKISAEINFKDAKHDFDQSIVNEIGFSSVFQINESKPLTFTVSDYQCSCESVLWIQDIQNPADTLFKTLVFRDNVIEVRLEDLK